MIQPPPAVPQLTSHTPAPALTHRAISHGAIPPPAGWSLSPVTRQTSSTLFQRFMAISTCQRHRYRAMIVWAVSTAGARVVKTNTQPANKNSPRTACLFYAPADICAGHDWLAPRSSDRRVPSPAPHVGHLFARSATARVRIVSIFCRFKAVHSSKGAPAVSHSTTLKG